MWQKILMYRSVLVATGLVNVAAVFAMSVDMSAFMGLAAVALMFVLIDVFRTLCIVIWLQT